MAQIEKLEMDAHRAQLASDLRKLVDKYRAIFDWDVPEVDEGLAERLILGAVRQALDDLEAAATGSPQPLRSDQPTPESP